MPVRGIRRFVQNGLPLQGKHWDVMAVERRKSRISGVPADLHRATKPEQRVFIIALNISRLSDLLDIT